MRATAWRNQKLSNETFIWYITPAGPSIKRMPGVGLSFGGLGMHQEGRKNCWLCSQMLGLYTTRAAELFKVSLGHVNLVIYFQMVEKKTLTFDLVHCVDLCNVMGFKCSVQSLIQSPDGWIPAGRWRSHYIHNKNFQPKITYGFNWRRRSCW